MSYLAKGMHGEEKERQGEDTADPWKGFYKN